jgi:hypothetical protein
MAVTNQQIIDYLLANPNLSDAQIVAAMEQNGISPSQMASAVGIPEGQIVARVAATVPNGNSVTLGDTRIAPQYQTIGSGMDQQIGGIENVYVEKVPTSDVNYKSPVGTPIQIYSPTGEFVNTIKTQKDQSFFGGLVDAFKDPVVQAALLGVAGGAGAFDGLLSGAAGGGATAAEAATAFDLANAGIAGGTSGFTAAELAAIDAASVANTGGAATGLLTNTGTGLTAGGTGLTTNTGLLTGGSDVVGMGGGTGLKVGTTGLDTITATNAGLNSGLTTGTNTGLLTTAGTTLAGIDTGVTAANAAATAKVAADAAAAAKLASQSGLITGALKTAGGLLQTEEDKAAAQLAAQNVNKATQTAQEAAQFRPVGMTTRFGTSQYTYDPVTGRMTSAGYQLSPEAKNAQDRLVALAGRGLTQAEQAQQQFAPLQTGAQNLFGLGNQYISQSPQDVAQNYINQQMQLLQPSREMELANLQNRLQQQGRAGLSVAQGGSLGATTPELQALYNARAQQELQLAANAQQAGQQNVLFGAGLLGQGATAMGNYYGGQQAAYSPFTTALGQIQGLETQAQQPLTMGANLAQQASTAGARAGQLGLQGTTTAAELSTGRAATTNPYASLLSGIDPAFAAGIAKQIWGA